MATVSFSTNCPRANSKIKRSWPHELGKEELGPTCLWHGLVPGKCWLNALQETDSPGVCSGVCSGVFYDDDDDDDDDNDDNDDNADDDK